MVVISSYSLFCIRTDLEDDEPAKAMRYKYQRSIYAALLLLARYTYLIAYLLPTLRSRLSARRSLSAVVRADCLIADDPNQSDLYPYRMMRAFGTTAGSISSS
jgi:hypothetical protein